MLPTESEAMTYHIRTVGCRVAVKILIEAVKRLLTGGGAYSLSAITNNLNGTEVNIFKTSFMQNIESTEPTEFEIKYPLFFKHMSGYYKVLSSDRYVEVYLPSDYDNDASASLLQSRRVAKIITRDGTLIPETQFLEAFNKAVHAVHVAVSGTMNVIELAEKYSVAI